MKIPRLVHPFALFSLSMPLLFACTSNQIRNPSSDASGQPSAISVALTLNVDADTYAKDQEEYLNSDRIDSMAKDETLEGGANGARSNTAHLTLAEFRAIFSYTVSGNMDVNTALGSRSSNGDPALISAQLKQDHLLELEALIIRMALQKIPGQAGIYWRGSERVVPFVKGQGIPFYGLTSISGKQRVAQRFAGKQLWVIHALNAKSIRNYSQIPNEDEYLLDHGTCLKLHVHQKGEVPPTLLAIDGQKVAPVGADGKTIKSTDHVTEKFLPATLTIAGDDSEDSQPSNVGILELDEVNVAAKDCK